MAPGTRLQQANKEFFRCSMKHRQNLTFLKLLSIKCLSKNIHSQKSLFYPSQELRTRGNKGCYFQETSSLLFIQSCFRNIRRRNSKIQCWQATSRLIKYLKVESGFRVENPTQVPCTLVAQVIAGHVATAWFFGVHSEILD